MSPDRKLLAFAGFNGAMAVALGAFAAHGAALAVALALFGSSRRLRLAGWLASAGGLVFCVALAMIGLLSLPVMGAVAPVGGAMMIAGWLLISFAAFQSNLAKT